MNRVHPRAVAAPVSARKHAVTKAGDWWIARKAGQRLPQHELPMNNQPKERRRVFRPAAYLRSVA